MDKKIVEVKDLEDIVEDYTKEIESLKARLEPLEQNIIEIIGIAEFLEEHI